MLLEFQTIDKEGNTILLSQNNIEIKPSKNNTQNCRPILSMNINVKIWNKILASKIQHPIKRINYCHQMGFILRMQGWFSVQKFVTLIHDINRAKKTCMSVFEGHIITFNKTLHVLLIFFLMPIAIWVLPGLSNHRLGHAWQFSQQKSNIWNQARACQESKRKLPS